jgi:Ca2+-binding RTX toxin-like protein
MAFILTGSTGADTIRGGSGADIIYGLGGDDSLSGGGGNDVFSFGNAFDLSFAVTIDGGAGFDTLELPTSPVFNAAPFFAAYANLEAIRFTGGFRAFISFDAGAEAAFTGGLINVSAATASGLFLFGSAVGPAGRFAAAGTANRDSIVGSAGADTIDGRGGGDDLYGNDGNDLFLFAGLAALADAFRLNGGDGTDTLRFTGDVAGTLVLPGLAADLERLELAGRGTQSLTLAAGTGAAFTDGILNITANAARGLLLDATALGTAEAVHVRGTAQADVIGGGAGADTIAGRGGADALHGQDGDDLFLFANLSHLARAVQIDGGGGLDTLRLEAPVAGTLSSAALRNMEAIEIAAGGATSLTLAAGIVAGFTGGAIAVDGRAATSLVLDGRLLGLGSSLTVLGSAGDDRLVAGLGNDVFTGGAGNDVFAFRRGTGSDVVTDFTPHAMTSPAAVTLDFNDLSPATPAPVPAGYQGFQWTNFSGAAGVASIGGVAAGAETASITRATPFDVEGFTLYAASSISAVLHVTALDAAGNVIGEYLGQNVYGSPTVYTPGWRDVTTLRFTEVIDNAALDNLILRDRPAEVARDRIHLVGFTQAQVEQVLATAGEVNGDTHLFLRNGADRIVLEGVARDELSLTDFLWG